MSLKPLGGKARHLIEGAGLFEQMARARDHGELLLAFQLLVSLLIQPDDVVIEAPDDEQRRRSHARQPLAGQVRPATA